MANGLFGTGKAPDNIDQVRISPAGLPGSTYVTPQRREVGTNLQRLAQSLGTLNGALSQFAAASAQEDKDPNSEANRAFLDSIQGMSMEEVAKKYPEARNRIQKDGALALVGSKAASEFRNEVAEWYNTEFDQANGNFQAEVEAKRQQYAEGLGDPAMKAAFFRETETFVQKFLEQDTERRVTGAVEERNTAVVDHFRNMVDDGLAKKLTPQQIAASILKESALSRDFYAMDGEAQNQTLFNIAVEYAAKGQTELVKALLDTDRVGADGKKIGALSKTAKFAAKSAELVQTAMTEEAQLSRKTSADTQFTIDNLKRTGEYDEKQAKDFMAKNPWYTPDMAAADVNASKTNKEQIIKARQKEEDRLRNRAAAQETKARIDSQVYAKAQGIGGVDDLEDIEVPNESGTGTETYSKEKQLDSLIKRMWADSEDEKQQLIDSGVDPKAADKEVTIRAINKFSAIKQIPPTWKREFGGVASSTTILRAAEKGEVASFVVDKAEKYAQIMDINPAMAEDIVTDPKDREFYDRYIRARKRDNLPPEAALLEAAAGTHASVKNRLVGIPNNKEFNDAVTSVVKDLGGERNAETDRAPVAERLDRYVKSGMPLSEAKEKAIDSIQENSFVVHGRLVIDDYNLPDNAPVLFEEALKNHFDMHGADWGIEDPEDLYVEPVGGGNYLVKSKSLGGLPLNNIITLTQLKQIQSGFSRQEREITEGKRLASVEEKKQIRARAERDLQSYEERAAFYRKRFSADRTRLLSGLKANQYEGKAATLRKKLLGLKDTVPPEYQDPQVQVPTP